MLTYAVRRILGAIPTTLVIIAIAFFMIRLAPGGPFDGDKPMPIEIKRNLEKAYHLDEPLYMQFARYMGNIVQGDFGPSFKLKDYSVNELIYQGFPYSLQIGLSAIVIASFFGILFGTIAALKQNSPGDYGTMAIAMVGITIPNFVVAPLLVFLFAVTWRILPAGGITAGWTSFILPIAALALPPTAYIARLTRASMIEVLRSNFVRTARAKGLPERITIVRHTLKAGLLPVVSYLGPATAGIITGSVVIEQIFGIPGIGRYFVTAALNRDYTLVMGTVIFFAVLIIMFNLLVDLLYGALDPRVRYD
ncbi:oligopeptide ABC transporter permease OppB [Inquilinus sp.]|jgi:oligopeptide transport system permease protein|uniref:oligopeptide ABC transporter permease OppB n=1 Tax=Inquilinus sp. TaxID=1932117 RepID=UPI0037831FC4